MDERDCGDDALKTHWLDALVVQSFGILTVHQPAHSRVIASEFTSGSMPRLYRESAL